MILNKEKVHQYREKKFWTLQTLANSAGVVLQTAWKAENGKSISAKSATKLAAALGVEPQKLI